MSRGGEVSKEYVCLILLTPTQSVPKLTSRYYYYVAAAKLGRRSRKMRETIAEACKTIEDNQTAQALSGLLSLKAETHDGVITLIAPSQESSSPTTIQSTNGSGITSVSSVTAAHLADTASATLVDAAQHAIDASAQKSVTESEQQLQKSLEKARICNSEVLNVSD